MRSLQGWRRGSGASWVGAGALVLFAFWALVPVVPFHDPLSTVILDRDGALLGSTIASDGQWRFGVADEVPERFVTAITCFEDRRFFRHPGVDPLALARAFVQNVRAGRVVSGGSTLTMQVVRLARRDRPRTYGEKAIEAVLALRLSLTLSKEEVLALYAAYAPFGGNTVGLDAAAWRYFGRSPDQLSWGETATLAVLPNAPSLVHPGRNRERLREKRNRLLDALQDRGVLDTMTADLAKSEPLPRAPSAVPRHAPHLLERVRSEERRRGAWRTGDESPWVTTTLSRDLQIRTTAVAERHHRRLAALGVHNAAALVAEVDTGRILAYVGNLSHFHEPHRGHWVDVVPAPRSTGSILKPLLYAAMLDGGEVLPGQLVPDVPTRMGAFHPENFDRTYSGAVRAERALARSLNVPAVRLLRTYGTDRFTVLLRRMGLTTLDKGGSHYGLSLILGGAEGTLFDVTGAYGSLGRLVERNARGEDESGAFHPLTYRPEGPEPRSHERPVGAAAAWLTLEAMLEVERPGDEFSWRTFSSSRKIAWKTGTSYGFRDAWAVGVTPRHVVGVWAGNADGEGRPGLTGYSAAAPLLFDLFDLLPGRGWFQEPEEGLAQVEVCRDSGMRRGRHCPRGRERLVTTRGRETPPCSYCRLAHLDPRGDVRVHGDCEPVGDIRRVRWFALPPAMETYYRLQHADYRPLPPLRPDCQAALGRLEAAALDIVSPREDATLYVPVEMDGSVGRVVFEAAHSDPGATVFWHLDGQYQGQTRDIHQMALAPPPGSHTLTLVDETGESVRRRFRALRRERPSRPSGSGLGQVAQRQ